jgi:NADH-quinone oxidoreductase subunit J
MRSIVSIEFIFFTMLSILAISSAILTISARNPVVSAISLIFHFFMLSGLYLTLSAQFIAVMQILVYAGAIMVLVIFVIMLLNLGDEEKLKERFNFRKIIAVLFGMVFIVQLSVIITSSKIISPAISDKTLANSTAQAIGNEIFSNYIFPFEIVGLLLFVAIVGAIVLAKRKIIE